ncbi:DUF2147 domain-containing protein [Parendozoicomonas sp. Alg238-R29]|uniref:DUF2147 domain-containing protein n=1 Tax=Parendozoicomonas sp. Alg238-R29 TaxID=2993446 RepID=UPI00248E906B|nr:DUF2147 domain-containing protein [Parendozoicomonas sp. Alg238-R29]
MNYRSLFQRFTLFGFLYSLLILAAPSSMAASIDGLWDMPDDQGTLDTTMHIYPLADSGKREGKAVILHRPQDQGAVCSSCSGERQNQPIIGMIFLEDLSKHATKDAWYGQVLDPDSGKTYSARLKPLADEKTLELCVYIATDRICLSRQKWSKSSFSLPEG